MLVKFMINDISYINFYNIKTWVLKMNNKCLSTTVLPFETKKHNQKKINSRDLTYEKYVDRIEKIKGNNTLNCRYLRSRNKSDFYILSPKDMLHVDGADVQTCLNAIKPDGIVIGCCLKRFKLFYNCYNNAAKATFADYITDALTFGISHSLLHILFDMAYQGQRKRDALLKSNVIQLHLPAIHYVNNNNDNPNIIVKYGDLQYRHVMNNIFFLNMKNLPLLIQYYLGKVSPKIERIIKKDEKFYRLFLKYRANSIIHSSRRLSSQLKLSPDTKTINPKVVILCEEWEAQYIASEWNTFFQGDFPPEKLTYVPTLMNAIKGLAGFYAIFLLITYLGRFIRSVF